MTEHKAGELIAVGLHEDWKPPPLFVRDAVTVLSAV